MLKVRLEWEWDKMSEEEAREAAATRELSAVIADALKGAPDRGVALNAMISVLGARIVRDFDDPVDVAKEAAETLQVLVERSLAPRGLSGHG
jgi:hypothetical protein